MDDIIIWIIPAYRIINFVGSVLLAIAAFLAWRRSRRVTWLLFLVALLLPIFASLGLGSYTLSLRDHTESQSVTRDERFIKAKVITGEVTGFVSSCLYLIAGIGVIMMIKEKNDPEQSLAPYGAQRDADKPKE